MELNEYKVMAAVEDRHWWWRARRDILSRLLDRHAPPVGATPRRVLEVGCGTGGNLPMLAEYGTVLGAEHQALAIEYLRDKHGDRFQVIEHSIPQEIPGPGRFDIVAMLDVLEHIEDDAAAMRWLASQLAPGGLALITVPALPLLWSGHDTAAGHFRRYTLESLTAVVPPELEILHQTYFNTLLFPLVAAVRLGLRLVPERWRPKGTHMGLPPSLLNGLLYRLFRLERLVAPRTRLPVGVSALLVLRRSPG